VTVGFWAETPDELFNKTQARMARLSRHRREVANEKPDERARRQQHRAEQMAHQLGSTRPGVVKAMLALVQADETVNPKGDPPDPVAPGARAALKPAKKTPAKPPLHNATPVTTDQQMGFWE
jgi:hypothetical protein